MLDEGRLLVARAPKGHPLHELYESIVNDHLSKLRTAGGRPYEILRLDTAPYRGELLAAYTNSLILNDVVYVPLFDIEQDEVALETWRAALPGHTVKGIRFAIGEEPALDPRVRRMYPGGLGWRSFDALHCRTRAVWDPEMLYLSVDRVPTVIDRNQELVVTASIVAYSGALLLSDQLALRWRIEGEQDWTERPLARGADGRFRASIPVARGGVTVEYFVVAADESGRVERSPRTAPAAVYRFAVKE